MQKKENKQSQVTTSSERRSKLEHVFHCVQYVSTLIVAARAQIVLLLLLVGAHCGPHIKVCAHLVLIKHLPLLLLQLLHWLVRERIVELAGVHLAWAKVGAHLSCLHLLAGRQNAAEIVLLLLHVYVLLLLRRRLHCHGLEVAKLILRRIGRARRCGGADDLFATRQEIAQDAAAGLLLLLLHQVVAHAHGAAAHHWRTVCRPVHGSVGLLHGERVVTLLHLRHLHALQVLLLLPLHGAHLIAHLASLHLGKLLLLLHAVGHLLGAQTQTVGPIDVLLLLLLGHCGHVWAWPTAHLHAILLLLRRGRIAKGAGLGHALAHWKLLLVCHVKVGRILRAWAHLVELLRAADAEGRARPTGARLLLLLLCVLA